MLFHVFVSLSLILRLLPLIVSVEDDVSDRVEDTCLGTVHMYTSVLFSYNFR